MRQVVINLANNAVKFTKEGEVFISAELEEDRGSHAVVRVSVTDTGVGIAPDRIANLFEPFSQADASTTRKYGGTGLGLSIAKRLVEAMGGQIRVESEGLGGGSTFSFTMVLEKQPPQEMAPAATAEDLRGVPILMVDDNATNRKILAHYLTTWGCDFEEAEGGEQAIRKLQDQADRGKPFRVVLLDSRMPGISGDEVAKSVSGRPHMSDTRLVMLTSLFRRRSASSLAETGLSAYLTKPVKRSNLRTCLVEMISDRPVEEGGRPATVLTERTLVDAAANVRTRILIVEDNLVNQRLAVLLLQKVGYRCEVANNGVEALEALASRSFDLVLMDCQMPEMDGFEATQSIRTREKETGEHIPIVAMTANAMDGDKERCLDAGMDDYISKPVDSHGLTSTLDRWLADRLEPLSKTRFHRRGTDDVESSTG